MWACERLHEMPGYDVIAAEGTKAGLVCPECNLILKAAVQTPEGDRLCESCYEAIARCVSHVVCLFGASVYVCTTVRCALRTLIAHVYNKFVESLTSSAKRQKSPCLEKMVNQPAFRTRQSGEMFNNSKYSVITGKPAANGSERF